MESASHEATPAKTIVTTYLIFQAIAIASWWVLLGTVPASIRWFQPQDWPVNALFCFGLADGVLIIAGSLIVAIGVLLKSSWAKTAIWSLATVVWYPTLVCLGVSVLTNEAWLSSAMMVSAAGLTLTMATVYGNARQQPATIRVTAMNRSMAVAWTLFQIVIFWGVFLWILPKGIVELEQRLGVPHFAHPLQPQAAFVLFFLASIVGLWSGITMATLGNGTPLPMATAPKLVIAGPYRFVRNPMALAGILQGIAVGWYFGSPSILVGALVGIFVWHVFVRPKEEADLRMRFGDAYAEYKTNVGLWWPRLR